MNENYKKYFFDIDYSLLVWEAGYKTVCTPFTTVTHVGGATLPHGSKDSVLIWNRDIPVFEKEWHTTGRLQSLQEGIWSRVPFTKSLVDILERIKVAFDERKGLEDQSFQMEVEEFMDLTKPFPLFRRFLATKLNSAMSFFIGKDENTLAAFCRKKLSDLWDAPNVPQGYFPIFLESFRGYNIISYQNQILLVPISFGKLDLHVPKNRELPGILFAKTLEEGKRSILTSGEEIETVPNKKLALYLDTSVTNIKEAIDRRYHKNKFYMTRVRPLYSWFKRKFGKKPFI